MQVVHTISELRAALSKAQRPVLVPTMGHLHDGHLNLVRRARLHGDSTVASIFVNRLQFLPHEDFERYPRDLAADCAALAREGCDLVFAPAESELYPEPQRWRVQPPAELADILEGAFRPGFFSGVATVIMKLFACVQPRVAVFGRKDYQQLLVVRSMVRQFAMPIEVVAVETTRAPDGLALSSRNAYLSAAQRDEAVQLARQLERIANEIAAGRRDLAQLERQGRARLEARGWAVDYLTARRRCDLLPPVADEDLIVLGAARLGGTRLIDNLEVPTGAKHVP